MRPKATTENPKRSVRIALLALLLVAGLLVFVLVYTERGSEEALLRVVFFDVGQGDAAFIESPEGVQVLIDGGADNGVLRHLSREMGFFDRTLDLMVATHPDTDHIGGLPDVLERYEVGTIVRTGNEGETRTAEAFHVHIENEGAHVLHARRGMRFNLGEDAMLEVLFPDRDVSMLESNSASIIMQLTYGDTEFLFTGDAPKGIEDYLVLLDAEGLASDVLKVGHHGSKTSTSELFVRAVDPDHAVISAGEDNRYGHPHQEVLDVYARLTVPVLGTYEEGTIIFESDGQTLRVR